MKSKTNHWTRALVMTLLVMLSTTSVQAEQVDETVLTVVTEVPTVDGGQTSNWGTNGSENYDKLVDGDLNTKYGLSNEDPYVEFHYEKAIVPKGYGLWTANDQSYRTPPAWTIKAKLNASDEWTTLVDRFYNRNYDKLPMTNNISATFTLDNTKSYKYFRFEAERCSSVSGKNFQLAELRFYVEREAGVLYESQVTLLQAIKSTGAQAFNTGYTHKANTRVELDCEVTKNSQRSWEALFGGRLGSYAKNAFVFFSRHQHNISAAINEPCFNRSGVETDGTNFVYDERIKLVCEGTTATWYKYSDLNTVVSSITTSGTADDGKTPMFLFELNTASSEGGTQEDNSKSVMTLYGCKIYEGSTLMRDYVPAKYNNVVGLYDRVNKTFSGSITSTAFLAVNDPDPNNQANYERALAAIEDGKSYRIFTMYNGQKYYVNADGKLSTAVADAPLFSFTKVAPKSADGDGEYENGFQIKNGSYYFTNSSEEDGSALKEGHICVTNKNSRTTWEAQVFFLNEEGKFAVRSTNAKSGDTGWSKVGTAFWTVDSSDNGPVAEYSYDMNYVWELEDELVGNYEWALKTIKDGKRYRVFTMVGTQKYYVTADGELSTNVDDAPLFSFNKVAPKANDGDGEYDYGFQIKNGSYYFTNSSKEDGSALKEGHICVTNKNSRTTWEAQVFFLNSEGKYAVRSTNAKSGDTGWAQVGTAFWTVYSSDNGAVAVYSYDMNYVWQIEGESTPTSDGIAINETNFPNAAFRNHLLSQDYGQDGVLTDEEIAGITELNFNGWQSINTLQGIEFLTSLKTLWCKECSLTSLDLSKNTNLDEIMCSSNQLTSLIVPKCNMLTHVSCFNNQLTSLDVSDNPYLNSLSCSNNQLTSLNISNTSVLNFYCYHNQLKGAEVDAIIANLLNMTSDWKWYFLQEDDSEGNVITKDQVEAAKQKKWIVKYTPAGSTTWVDYEGAEPTPTPDGLAIDETNFPDANFRAYLLSRDYGQDGVLTDEEIKGIYSISIYGKSIIQTNGSRPLRESSPSLRQAGSIKTTVYPELQSLQGIEHFTGLRDLTCKGCKLTTIDLSKNTILRYLNLYDNQLTSLDLSKNTELEYLYCEKNQLTQLDLSKNTYLYNLTCSENQLTTLILPQSQELCDLICNDNQLTTLDVSMYTYLDYLYCENNQLTTLDVSQNNYLRYLAFYDNQIKGAGMDALVASLPAKQDDDKSYIWAFDATNEGGKEGNVMTTTQVEAAKQKNWNVYYLKSEEDGWTEYEGSTAVITYPVWLGDTQVTDANKGDVLGDGTVTYEPGEGTGTLTFSSGTTTINGMYNAAKIYADGINLTIDAPKGLFIENNVYGIYMSGANSELTVNGDLTFKTSQNPIYNSSRININGNLTAAEGYTGINAKYIAVNGNVNMKLSTYCISASEIVLNGTKHELSASSPCLSGTNITVTGDLTATSNNTPVINAKGDVTLVSGTWTLDGGNTRAIEWGSNANLNIPSTYAIIEPENAQIQSASSGYNARKTIADAEGNEATHVVIGDPSAFDPCSNGHDFDANGECTRCHLKQGVTLVLYDDKTNTNNPAYIDAGSTPQTVELLGRTLKGGHWNTLCLPFAMSAEQIADSPLKNAFIRELVDYTNDGSTLTLTFSNVTEMYAGMAYIVWFEGDDIVNPVFKDVTISLKHGIHRVEHSSDDYVLFTGSPDPELLQGGDRTCLFLQNDNFYYPTADVTVGACRGTLKFSKEVPASARIVIDFGEDGDATLVNSERVNSEQLADEWYTLDGRKLSKRPTKKGVYINRGKKTIVK